MSAYLDALRAHTEYVFFAVGVLWLAVAVLAGSLLILWPAVACLLGGLQLKMWPGRRLTWSWAVSTAILGFLLAAYQVYAWAPFLEGTFSSVAAEASGAFVVLALLHLFLLFVGAKPASKVEPS